MTQGKTKLGLTLQQGLQLGVLLLDAGRAHAGAGASATGHHGGLARGCHATHRLLLQLHQTVLALQLLLLSIQRLLFQVLLGNDFSKQREMHV